MRVVFMGSPLFAVPSLEALVSKYNLVGVVTQPDRPSGRGRKVNFSAVKTYALEHELPIFQPARLRDRDSVLQLKKWDADLFIIAAYGQILSQEILDLPAFGCLNVHASLLPRWRGAAPIQASILHGDDHTGITMMRMDAGLDTGPILTQRSLKINPHETSGELAARLAILGAGLLMDTLPDYVGGNLTPITQNEEMATYAPTIRKEEGWIDFSRSSEFLSRQVRAFDPWPGSFFYWGVRRVVVKRTSYAHGHVDRVGKVFLFQDQPAVMTGDGYLILLEIQPSGKNSMSGASFLRGAPDFIGADLSIFNQLPS
jgi:methionyl-tRNA formyltransferase